MADTFTCTIRSSDGDLLVGELRSLTLPTASGEVEVLPGHAEAFIAVVPGAIAAVDAAGNRRDIPSKTGVLHVAGDRAVIVF